MAVTLPEFIVLKFVGRPEYMGYQRGGGANGYVRMSETFPQSPYARFAVEVSNVDGSLVHIRSFQSNRYLERVPYNFGAVGQSIHPYWIAATAEKREEDRSKESCTLFRVSRINDTTFRMLHVQSGCLVRIDYTWGPHSFVHAVENYIYNDGNERIEIIDWNSLMILPRFVHFKGPNGRYLRRVTIRGNPFLQFSGTEAGDINASFEIFNSGDPDGSIRIKPLSDNRFWRRSSNWILADSAGTNNRDTLFRAVKVDDDTIGLQSLGNNRFCRILTADGNSDCLNADTDSISVNENARLTVEEAIAWREFSNIRYDFENSRVYDDSLLVVARTSATNSTRLPTDLTVLFNYSETQTSSWKNNLSLKFGLKSSLEFGIPLIIGGKVELSTEVQHVREWGDSDTRTPDRESRRNVSVPPMKKVTVDLFARYGLCDVPFFYTQNDRLYNGQTITTEVVGGMYTGSNYFNVQSETRNEDLTATSKLYQLIMDSDESEETNN
ncbi:Agglutinin [Corchorus olitorius]|uniref:Agglutinin n=1 Tax=Corchorus olitorius TaxID=93759 RepID=A0A1R3HSN4_9ROSI|nr:Agglutinin [Corchorus olitorius]